MIIQEHHANNYDNNRQEDCHFPKISKQHAFQFIFIYAKVLAHSFAKLMSK